MRLRVSEWGEINLLLDTLPRLFDVDEGNHFVRVE
jgi:hypothetical protein